MVYHKCFAFKSLLWEWVQVLCHQVTKTQPSTGFEPATLGLKAPRSENPAKLRRRCVGSQSICGDKGNEFPQRYITYKHTHTHTYIHKHTHTHTHTQTHKHTQTYIQTQNRKRSGQPDSIFNGTAYKRNTCTHSVGVDSLKLQRWDSQLRAYKRTKGCTCWELKRVCLSWERERIDGGKSRQDRRLILFIVKSP